MGGMDNEGGLLRLEGGVGQKSGMEKKMRAHWPEEKMGQRQRAHIFVWGNGCGWNE